jgi:hypothetical protein
LPNIVTAPSCFGPTKSPAANCNEYYECEQVWWWWEPRLKTCPEGETFNTILNDCDPSDPLNCYNLTTIYTQTVASSGNTKSTLTANSTTDIDSTSTKTPPESTTATQRGTTTVATLSTTEGCSTLSTTTRTIETSGT